ncbi:MAG: NAD(P)-dependent alcohol dehydrogenase [Myxococcales bacterium]|nr:NAD(P)-dependent alcohol dehydrogenase [Myxococcales bacterium]
MKAYELHREEGLAALKLVDRPSPPLGPTDVRVRVRAVSLNYRDLSVLRGAQRRERPVVPTSDGAGEVIEVGSAVRRHVVGDRVAAAFFPGWQQGGLTEEHHKNALGGSADGMLAEEVVLPESAWVRAPSKWSFEQASTLPCAGVTAWHALFEAASLRPGDSLLVQGTGGVSIFALQLARAAGANVIATSSSAEKRARLEQMGAVATLDYKATPQWGDAVRAASGGRGVDVAVEVGGAGTFDQTVKALRYGGTMSLLGILAGTQGPIDTYAVFHKALRVHGVYVGSVAMFESLVRALEASGIEPVVDRAFAFGDAARAYEHLASGAHFGKVVIRVG